MVEGGYVSISRLGRVQDAPLTEQQRAWVSEVQSRMVSCFSRTTRVIPCNDPRQSPISLLADLGSIDYRMTLQRERRFFPNAGYLDWENGNVKWPSVSHRYS